VTVKLLGADDATGSGDHGQGYFVLHRYQAETSGSMTLFYLRCGVAGNIKVALYADNAGEPGALITAMNTGQAVTAGWVSVSFTSTAIVSGNYYWLGFCPQYNCVRYTDAGTRRYKAATYDTFIFPDPAGTGFNPDTYGAVTAGWGEPPVTTKTSSDTGSGADAYVSLEKGEAKTSSDAGSGVEGTPVPSASLAGSETGSSIDATIARLLASFDTGYGIEVGSVEVGGLFKELFATELGWGSDSLTAKIETPTKGGGMKLWT
jgi:hypothetical protein